VCPQEHRGIGILPMIHGLQVHATAKQLEARAPVHAGRGIDGTEPHAPKPILQFQFSPCSLMATLPFSAPAQTDTVAEHPPDGPRMHALFGTSQPGPGGGQQHE
jgi:hypothetical protein